MAKCKLCCKEKTGLVGDHCTACNVPTGHSIYDCDGSSCSNKVRFRIAANKLETGVDTDTEDFKVTDVYDKLGELFIAASITADPKTGTPGIFTLCPDCWLSTSTSWSGGPYDTAAGKCTTSGFYFNANRPDYIKGTGEVNIDKVRSTAVHELMHWRSKDEKGLQDYSSGTNWDECITDALGREVYYRLGHDNYVTGYGNLTKFCELAADAYLSNYTGPNRTNWKAQRPAKESKPPAIVNILNTLYNSPPASKIQVKKDLINVIFKFFTSYHNKGPAVMLNDASVVSNPANFATFIKNFSPTGLPNLAFAQVTYAKTTSQRYPTL